MQHGEELQGAALGPGHAQQVDPQPDPHRDMEFRIKELHNRRFLLMEMQRFMKKTKGNSSRSEEGRTNETPSGTSETPSGTSETPSGTNETRSETSETPSGTSETPSGTSETRSETSETPSGTNEMPSGTSETPSGTSETPSGTSETPSGTSETPSGTSETPSGTSETPSGTSETPSGTNETRSETSETPSGTNEMPSGTSETPSGTSETPLGTSETPLGTSETPLGTSDSLSGTWGDSGQLCELEAVQKELDELLVKRRELEERGYCSGLRGLNPALYKAERPCGGVYTLPPPQLTAEEDALQRRGKVRTVGDIVPVDCLGQTAALTKCPSCDEIIVTETQSQVGEAKWLICLLCVMSGCVAGCCLIPFCMSRLNTVQHQCPKCHAKVHTHSPF